MAKKAVRDALEVVRMARGRVTESAATIFTELEIDTQLSVDRGFIWLIHWIEFEFERLELLDSAAQGDFEEVFAQITKSTQTAIITLDDPDLVQKKSYQLARAATIGTDAGPISFLTESVSRIDYPIPVPYAGQGIFFGIQGTEGGGVHTIAARIGYTLQEVDDRTFYRIAQALIG